MSEDTTAQLREQIAAVFMARGEWWTDRHWDEFADQILPIVLAQVEAAKATARREALLEAADEIVVDSRDNLIARDFDAGADAVYAALRARASAQGAAAPAEEDECATTTASATATSEAVHALAPGADSGSATERTVDLPNGFREHFGLTGTYATSKTDSADPQRPGGQGAQSSGHEFDHCTMPNCPTMDGQEHCRVCDGPFESEVHTQRVPGQPGEQDTPAGRPAEGDLPKVDDQAFEPKKWHRQTNPDVFELQDCCYICDRSKAEHSAAGSTDGAGTPGEGYAKHLATESGDEKTDITAGGAGGEICKIGHDLYGACELPHHHDGPHSRVPGGTTEANRWWGTTCDCHACRFERAKLAEVQDTHLCPYGCECPEHNPQGLTDD